MNAIRKHLSLLADMADGRQKEGPLPLMVPKFLSLTASALTRMQMASIYRWYARKYEDSTGFHLPPIPCAIKLADFKYHS